MGAFSRIRVDGALSGADMPLIMTSAPLIVAEKRSFLTGMKRGAAMRCPNCGKGALYRKYLKVQACPTCGNDNTVYPADDAPPYFTILIVGHLVVAPALCFSFIWTWPAAWVLAVTLPAI